MYDETHKFRLHKMRSLCSRFLVHLGVNKLGYTYDEIHQIQIALIKECGLYTYGSLFALLYLGVNISRCNQEPELYTYKTRMYDETHQIQIALITKCCLYTHGSLFGLLFLVVNNRTYLN